MQMDAMKIEDFEGGDEATVDAMTTALEGAAGDSPEPKPEDEPEPKPEDSPEPKPEDEPEPKPEDGPEPKPEDAPEPKPEDGPKVEELAARVSELEGELAAAVARAEESERLMGEKLAGQAAMGADVPAVLLAESEAEISRREDALEGFVDRLEEWLEEHDTDDVLEEDGKQFSFQDVRRTARKAKRELTRTIPRARLVLKDRLAARERATSLYPDVLKAGSADRREADRLLAAVPGLRALSDWPLWVGRMLAGKKLEAARAPGKASVGPAKVPPRSPVSAAAAGAARGGRKVAPAADERRVKESGYDEEVMLDEMAKVL